MVHMCFCVLVCICVCVCWFVCLSEWGLILQQFIQEGSITIADAHSGWRYVLQDVYSPPQAPVYIVGIPCWVTLPGHVDLYKRALGLGSGGRRPHLEDGKTRLGHILFRLWLGHVGWCGRGCGWGWRGERETPEQLGTAGWGGTWLEVGSGRMEETVVQQHDQDAPCECQVDAAQCQDGIGVGQHWISVGIPTGWQVTVQGLN